ncbi:MAG: orotidine-5'-phosphate decarboxylase [Candidatus Omnitrophica bacterium]|nr:orotidine-5'-phosphate decarboxylase [Candidatus Omnitrophota bacterium]
MKKLIIALDLSDKKKIYKLVEKIGEKVDFYKIGIIPYLLFGNEIIKWLKKEKKKIFFDLKFFDIPNTVKNAVKIISEHEVDMFTVHLMAGEKTIKEIVEIKKELKSNIKIIGVTILTSLAEKDLKFLGINMEIKEIVKKLVRYAYEWGTDGVVCSGQELKDLRKAFKPPFLMIVPGVRMEKSKDDQKRIITPEQAIKDGADFIVVGRPIYESKNPIKVVEKILKEIKDER